MQSVESVLTNTICPFHLSIIDNSQGGLDKELDTLQSNKRITIYRNNINYGKGVAFNQWYYNITTKSKMPYFISIDGDIKVSPKWLIHLKLSYHAIIKHQKPGIIAPVIMNHEKDTFKHQLQNKSLSMHVMRDFNQISYHKGLYTNRHIAGPLFMIDTKFFKSVGGYYEGQLYGADDGILCMQATKQKRFVGIDSNISVLHLNNDTTDEYNEWKRRNITKDVDHKGYWDQSQNPNNNDQ